MSKITIIAAIGKNRELGKQNDLIWHLKKDMQHFKNNTMGHKVIMGHNTFLSIPKRLAGREEIVLTHKEINEEGITSFNDLNTLLNYLDTLDEEVFIIGGASIYKLFLPYASELLLTEVSDSDADADVYFPEWNDEDFNRRIIEEINDESVKYKFVKYTRKEK